MIYENLKRRSNIDIALDNETRQIEKEINEDRIYERFFAIDKGDVVVDIGAHVGVFSQRALDLGASKVYALEPDPLFYSKLKQRKGIHTNQVAIAATHGTSFITSTGHANTLSDSGDTAVETISMKELSLVTPDIDFLKVDCEGGEYDIFAEDNMPWIAEHCKKIACEFHIHNDKHRENVVKIFDLFEKYGILYRITTLDGYSLGRNFDKNHFTEVLVYAVTPSANIDLNRFGIEEKVICHFVDGPYVQVNSNLPHRYQVTFKDGENVYFETDVANNGGWARGYHKYFISYQVTVTNLTTGRVIHNEKLDLEGKNVVIELLSSALGDTLAWVPYAEEFRKKHNCHLRVVTFHNHLFRDAYPHISWSNPGAVENNIYAWYKIGWSYNEQGLVDRYKHPCDPKGGPLQKTATDILGLEYREIRPKLAGQPKRRPIEEKYVCIAIHSTSQAKYWNYPQGWQKVVEYLKKQGYTVVLLSRENDGHNGNFNPKGVEYPPDFNIHTIMNYLYHSEFFIGLGSGLSWLSWAMNKQTVIISGFSEEYSEMADCIRIGATEGKCRGCYNWIRLQHDGDWNWCPRYKDTSRQFECTKSISPTLVISKLPI